MLWSTVTSLQSLGTHAWEQQEMAKAMYQLYHQPPPCERLATSIQYWALHAAAKVLKGWRRTTSRDLARAAQQQICAMRRQLSRWKHVTFCEDCKAPVRLMQLAFDVWEGFILQQHPEVL